MRGEWRRQGLGKFDNETKRNVHLKAVCYHVVTRFLTASFPAPSFSSTKTQKLRLRFLWWVLSVFNSGSTSRVLVTTSFSVGGVWRRKEGVITKRENSNIKRRVAWNLRRCLWHVLNGVTVMVNENVIVDDVAVDCPTNVACHPHHFHGHCDCDDGYRRYHAADARVCVHQPQSNPYSVDHFDCSYSKFHFQHRS